MKKIKLDFTKAINKEDVFDLQNRVSEINKRMNQGDVLGSDFLGWKDLPENINSSELTRMKNVVQFLENEKVEVLVVIGIGGSYLGAKAAIDFIQGQYPLPGTRKMEIIFTGTSVSSSALYRTLKYVENKKFAINVISKSGTTTEPAIAFREFKKILELKLGIAKARQFIFATTDAKKGTLFDLATKEGYEKFIILDNVGGRFSVLSPVGLFPMLAAGLNVDKVLLGAKEANKIYSLDDLKNNEAYQYAVVRYLLSKKYSVEMLVSYEPDFAFFNEWWKQLFGESEGKDNKGLLPVSSVFSTDLHSLGQFIQDGSKILFETIITLNKPHYNVIISKDETDLDNLNYLAGKSLHQVNNAAFKATFDAHVNTGKVPNIHLLLEDNNEESLGWLIMFFERACAISAYLLGVNPFDQPGVEVYKKNMFAILGKPKS